MLNLDLLGNGDNPSPVKKESIQRALDGLVGPQREFVELCLRENKAERPNATSLLKHPALQVVSLLEQLRLSNCLIDFCDYVCTTLIYGE